MLILAPRHFYLFLFMSLSAHSHWWVLVILLTCHPVWKSLCAVRICFVCDSGEEGLQQWFVFKKIKVYDYLRHSWLNMNHSQQCQTNFIPHIYEKEPSRENLYSIQIYNALMKEMMRKGQTKLGITKSIWSHFISANGEILFISQTRYLCDLWMVHSSLHLIPRTRTAILM